MALRQAFMTIFNQAKSFEQAEICQSPTPHAKWSRGGEVSNIPDHLSKLSKVCSSHSSQIPNSFKSVKSNSEKKELVGEKRH